MMKTISDLSFIMLKAILDCLSHKFCHYLHVWNWILVPVLVQNFFFCSNLLDFLPIAMLLVYMSFSGRSLSKTRNAFIINGNGDVGYDWAGSLFMCI